MFTTAKTDAAAAAVKSAETVKSALHGAIEFGTPQHNEGDIAGCARTFTRTAEAVVRRCEEEVATTNALRGVLRETAKMSGVDKVAWALRRVFDTLLDRSVDPRLSAS